MKGINLKSAVTSLSGMGIISCGRKAAMTVASRIGVAKTGTAISELVGVAETNASLAWLGRGSMAAGKVVLKSIPYVGWALVATGTGYGIYRYCKSRNYSTCIAKTIS